MISYDDNIVYDAIDVTFDGDLLVIAGLGYEALFSDRKGTCITDPAFAEVPDPRGYMTGKLPERKSFRI